MRALLYVMLFAVVSAASADRPTPQPSSWFHEIVAKRETPFIDSPSMGQFAAQACCKVCTKGKACGDTCIAQDKTCHVGPGCACDG